MPSYLIHRFESPGIPVNSYLVESQNGVVVIDSTLTMSGGKGVRLKLESLNKPLLAVLVTHAHPEHYAGLKQVVASDQVPIVAAEGVDKVIRRDDALKNQIIGAMLGEEWPTKRIFPNQTKRNGESVAFDGLTFTLIDLGPGESPHDSIWKLEGDEAILFAGDLAYHHMHSYLLDGFYEDWLRNIQRISAEYANAKFYIGHAAISPAMRNSIRSLRQSDMYRIGVAHPSDALCRACEALIVGDLGVAHGQEVWSDAPAMCRQPIERASPLKAVEGEAV